MTRPIDVRLFISRSQRSLQVMELVRPCFKRARDGFDRQGAIRSLRSRLGAVQSTATFVAVPGHGESSRDHWPCQLWDGRISVDCSSRLLSGGVAAGIGPAALSPAEIYRQPTARTANKSIVQPFPTRFTVQKVDPFSPDRSSAWQPGVPTACLFHCWDAGISGKLNSFSQGKEFESLSEMAK